MKVYSPIEMVRRYATLKNHRIYSMPIVILMPHSRCNCRCVMCDIWKGNNNVQQLEVSDIEQLLSSLKKLRTRLVVMSGGEALMHPDFFILAAKFVRSEYVNFITKEVSGNLCFTLTQNEVEELIVHI